MKTVIVLAIHRRPAITLATLSRLKRQTVEVEIIVVGDSEIEREIAKKADVYYTEHPNQPLAAKYQHGIYFARDLEPDFIMTTGSDSWVSNDWIETMQAISDYYSYDGIGKSIFAAFHIEKRKIRERGYLPPRDSEPDGNGRVFTRSAMEKLDWRLYPDFPYLNGIDGASHAHCLRNGLKIKTANFLHDIKLLEIKSDKWLSINGWDAFNSQGLKFVADADGDIWMDTWFPGWKEDLEELIWKQH